MTSGVYVITNKTNGRRYVGQTRAIEARWKQHRKALALGRHHNKNLQRDWRTHGPDAFEFSILERVEGEDALKVAERRVILDWFDQSPESVYNTWDGLRYSRFDEHLAVCLKLELPSDLEDWISQKAAEEGISANALVNRIVREYADRKQPRPAARPAGGGDGTA